MPIIIQCHACPTKLKVPETAKAVKCPKCAAIIKVADAKPAAAATPAKAVAPPPKAAPAARVAAAPKPAPAKAPAAAEDEWLDVNEAAAAPAVATKKGGAPAGDWGQNLMEDHGVPDDMQQEIRATLTRNERLVWFDRPQLEIMMYQARKFQITGMLVGGVGAVGMPVVAWWLFQKPESGAAIGAWICLFFAVVLALVGVYAFFAPSIQRKNGPRRACFALTNRRLLIHPGKGTQMFHGRSGGTALVVGTGNLEIISYSGLELTRLWRIESKRFPGCGEVVFTRNLLDEPAGGGLWALKDVCQAEKILREKLVHPLIDKLLRGESLTKEDRATGQNQPAQPEDDSGKKVAPDHNIKEYVSGGKAPKGAAAKDATVGVEHDLKKVPAEWREQVEAELTAGERILWIGRPEGNQKSRNKGGGFLGSMAGAEDRREPVYTLYALTSRRVLLWADKSTTLQSRNRTTFTFGGQDPRGPLTYYPPHLVDAGLEEDKDAAGVGSVVFKLIEVIIETRVKSQQTGMTKTRTHTQLHYFGMLHVRKYLAVARLVYETLIAPCRGL